MRTTFIGLGNMGAQLVRSHLRADTSCTIWNRSQDKSIVSELQDAGARYERDLSAAIAASEYLLMCLPDHESCYSCLEALQSKGEARTALSTLRAVINLSNGSPKDAETMDKWMKDRSVPCYISCAIMAGPENIGDSETAFMLYSGNISDDLQAKIEGLISVLGKPEYVGSAIGNAQLNNNASLAATYSLFAGALLSSAILSQAASASDLSPGQQSRVLKPFQSYVAPLLKPAAGELDGLVQSVEEGNDDAQGASISMIGASLRNLTKTCSELGIDAGIMEHLSKLCAEMDEAGDGGKGMAALARKMIIRM